MDWNIKMLFDLTFQRTSTFVSITKKIILLFRTTLLYSKMEESKVRAYIKFKRQKLKVPFWFKLKNLNSVFK